MFTTNITSITFHYVCLNACLSVCLPVYLPVSMGTHMPWQMCCQSEDHLQKWILSFHLVGP